MKKRHQKRGICIYCGLNRTLTVDHIPPKCLFPKPRPSDLVKVPSCRECNASASKDDEYFRLMLTLREDAFGNANVEALLPTVYRSLNRESSIGFRKLLLKNLRTIEVHTPAGLYLGNRKGYNVDLERLGRVAARTVKGLFYHEKGFRLPDSHKIGAFQEDGLRDLAGDARKELLHTIIAPLTSKSPKEIGKKAFKYWVSFTDTDPCTSAWLLIFYERVPFICLVLPQNAKIAAE